MFEAGMKGGTQMILFKKDARQALTSIADISQTELKRTARWIRVITRTEVPLKSFVVWPAVNLSLQHAGIYTPP